jgi:hypothetical protein
MSQQSFRLSSGEEIHAYNDAPQSLPGRAESYLPYLMYRRFGHSLQSRSGNGYKHVGSDASNRAANGGSDEIVVYGKNQLDKCCRLRGIWARHRR